MVQRPRPDLRGGCVAIRIPTATAGGGGGGPTTGVPTATQSRGLSPARGHWRSYTPVPIISLNRRGLYLSVF